MATRSFQGAVVIVNDGGVQRKDSPLTTVQPRGVTVHNAYLEDSSQVVSTVFFEDAQLEAVLAAAASVGMVEVQA